jgi:hypothetical protein
MTSGFEIPMWQSPRIDISSFLIAGIKSREELIPLLLVKQVAGVKVQICQRLQ